jgi:phosphinothricin acetyltransferase
MLIRLATESDLPAINDIYNHFVPISTTTYDLQPMSIDDRRRWFKHREPIHPVTVAEQAGDWSLETGGAEQAGDRRPATGGAETNDKTNAASPPTLQPPASSLQPAILGFGSLHIFRQKCGYRLTVENSVYVHPDHHRQGVGSAIILDQIERARQLGLHAIVAGIDAEQEGSLALHYKHGFREVGRFPQIGRKFDRWLDAVFMQLIL